MALSELYELPALADPFPSILWRVSALVHRSLPRPPDTGAYDDHVAGGFMAASNGPKDRVRSAGRRWQVTGEITAP